MSAAMSSRSSATSSRSRSAWCARRCARTSRRAPISTPRNACSKRWSARRRARPRATASARSCATANSTTRKSRSRSPTPAGGMPGFEIPGMPGANIGVLNINDMLSKAMGGKRTKTRKTTVKESYGLLVSDESDKLLDQDEVVQQAHRSRPRTTASSSSTRSTRSPSREGGIGAGVSREGVQRDLLPLVEGTTVATKYGPVKTDHVLFIASGAFHVAKPSDLLPELQGRLPIRVELRALEKDDFVRILTETEASLIKQYIALMETEGVDAVVHRRRHRLACRHRRRPQRQRREHRRAAPADGDGARAGRDLVQRARPRRHRGHHRRRLCRQARRRSGARTQICRDLSFRRNCRAPKASGSSEKRIPAAAGALDHSWGFPSCADHHQIREAVRA